MARRGVRRLVAVCGVAFVTVLAAACSGGGSPRVDASPHTTTVPRGVSSPTTTHARAKKHSTSKTKTKSKSKSKSKSKTSASTKKAVATKRAPTKPAVRAATTGSTPTTLALLFVPAGTVGGSSTPGTVGSASSGGTTPHTAPRTTTTVPGPKPYDPSKPIDLGGEPGVTAAEQARAEQLVRDTLRDLPKYASSATAYADGYRSIGDAFTGTEHFVKWAYVDDGHILDSKYPESLVYQYRNGKQTLVSAMYMMPFGTRFTDVPDVGGPLTQWHVHSTLCLLDSPGDPLQKVIGGFTGTDGSCPAGSTPAGSSPMLHVWIVKNSCGPFAALEGIEAGEPPPGETRLCDTGHGSV